MKKTSIVTLMAFFTLSGLLWAENQDQPRTGEFKVFGVCEMCKARIEKAAKTDGVISAVWDVETKILKIEYIPSIIKIEEIHKNIARVGHDTEMVRADDEVYNKLPSCCKYERVLRHDGHKH